jgi:autotransporter-associated beta strand protein
MKTQRAYYSLLAALFLFPVLAGEAATISWGVPATISGDGDVSTNGVGVYAYTGGSTGATVNGVAFVAGNNGSAWGSSVILSGFGTPFNAYTATNAPWTNLSAAYMTVLQGGAYGGATTATVSMNGLTMGRSYAVQIWVNDPRSTGSGRSATVTSSGGNTVSLDYNNLNAVGGVGQSVVGTFVANATNQPFTLTSASSVQLNAISLRDYGAFNFTATRVNLAKYQPVRVDSTNGTQGPAFITDGLIADTSYWQSGSSGVHWAEVDFPFPTTVGSVQLVMGRDTVAPPTAFGMQYLSNSIWITVPGSSIANNTNKERNIVFTSPITATAFRFYDSLDGTVYLREMALYPPGAPGGFPFGTDFFIDLARKQPAFATTNTPGNWPYLPVDGLVSPASAWKTTLVGSNSLLVNLQFTNKIGSAHLYSGMTGVAPLTNFVLQYWTGGAWANIPGGTVTGNTNAALVIPFTTPVTTTEVQLVFTNSSASAVQELCVFSANSNVGYPLGTGIVTNTPVTAKYDTYTDSYYYLSNAATAQVIMDSNGLPVVGPAAVTNWAGQYQVLLNYDNGTYRLINRATGLCLAGAQLTTNIGAALVEESYSALPDQDWFLQPVNGTGFYFVNQFSGLVLDAQNGALVQNTMTNSASQLWQIPFVQTYPKKGIAGSSRAFQLTFESNWTYGWWYTSDPNVPGVNYFPMDPDSWYRNSTVANNLWSFQPGWRVKGYSLHILGYNEPDQVGQANLDATNGAIYYMNDQNLDLPMVGPAAANVNGTWNQIFFGYITNWGCRMDYLPAHEYPGNSSSASSSIWISPMQTAYNTYGIPMWMTEFSVVDWSGTGSWSEEDNYNALAEFLWRAESVSWLRKYSLFVFTADTNNPMAVNPWTRTTPAPRSNAFDTNGNLTPFGELYAAWDNDANVETNKIYYIHNNSTRKRLQNSSGANADANNIRINDFSAKWTLQPVPSTSYYYIVSSLDGRKLSYTNGGSVSLVASNTTGTAVQWSLTPYQYGWYYLDHPATSLRLSLAYNNTSFTATYSMVAQTTTSTAVQWRFIPTLPPTAWTGLTDNLWSSAGNWTSQQAPLSGQGVVFDNNAISNLNTVLDTNFTVSLVTVTAPAGAVSIGGTNLLSLGNGIDLSAASQNLTITAPVMVNGVQSWNVSGGRTLTVNGSVSGGAAVNMTGGGTVVLGGTNAYTGATTVGGGTWLRSTAPNIFPNGASAGDFTITNGGALDVNGFSQTINGLNGDGSVDNSAAGTVVFTVGSNNASSTFSGKVQNTGGNLTLVKTGTGTLTLLGTNAHSGGTILNAGNIGPKNNFVFGGGLLTVNGGIIFNSYNPGLNLTFTNPVNLNGGTLRTGGGQATTKNTWAGLVTVTANSTVQSDGVTLGNTFTGGVNLGNSGCTLTNGGNGNNSGSANNFNSVISGGPNATVLGNASGLVYLNAANTFSGTFRSGYSLVLQNALALQNATLDMNAADAGSVTLVNNAVIGALTGARNLNLGGFAISIGNNNASTTFSGALTNSGSLTKVGSGTLTLTGTNTFTGTTAISGGTLALSGNASLASTNFVVGGGTTFNVSGLASPFALAGRTLTNSAGLAVLNGNFNCTNGTLSLLFNGTNAPLVITNGAVTLSAGTIFKVNNTGAPLAAGSYPLITAVPTGNPGLVNGALPAVVLGGNGATGAASLQINGGGGLNLLVASAVATNSTNISFTVTGGALTLSWPADHLGWIAQSNSLNLAGSNYWFDIPGSQSVSNLVIPINASSTNVFYRLRYPN